MPSTIYTMDGEMYEIDELYEGKQFFRKMSTCSRELEICKILSKLNHPNIVKIFQVGENFIDMEVLDDSIRQCKMVEVKLIMQECKQYLQELGIIYVDWKLDNIGISSEDHQYKLFDFDGSGIINKSTFEWIKKPNTSFFSYRKAIENDMKTPVEIDNFSFNMNFK